MISYSYKINKMLCSQQIANRPDFVVEVICTITGISPDGTARVSTHAALTFTPGSGFTAFNDLTENDVISWIEQHPDRAKYTAIIEAKMPAAIERARLESRDPPWQPKQEVFGTP